MVLALGMLRFSSKLFSSATCMSRVLTSSSGVLMAAWLFMASFTNSDWMSRFSNCFSNWSMVAATCSRLLACRDLSSALTMPAMDLLMVCRCQGMVNIRTEAQPKHSWYSFSQDATCIKIRLVPDS